MKAINPPISDSVPEIDRWKSLEGDLKRRVAINGMVFEEIFQRLDHLEGAVSKLASESPELATSNSGGELDSELPSGSPAAASSELDSELPDESLNENLPLTINGSHRYFNDLVICDLGTDESLYFWTGSKLSDDVGQALLYSNQKLAQRQADKLQHNLGSGYNIKITTARNCITKDASPYRLKEIFDDWKQQEDRKVAKRKSARKKAAIATDT